MDVLPVGLYEINVCEKRGMFLSPRSGGFELPTKLYGIETPFIERVAKTFASTSENMGIMLTGLRGTGKTVTAELIANRLNQPVIMIKQDQPGIIDFMDMIPHPVTFFVDEFEKAAIFCAICAARQPRLL